MAPRSRKKESSKPSTLVTALKFLSLVTKAEGDVKETHIAMNNNFAIANDGIVALGHPIEENIVAAPHNKFMLEALLKCGQDFQITQLQNSLSVKGGKFKANVPCVMIEDLHEASPDTQVANLNDEFKKAFQIVGVLADEKANSIATSSVLMQPGSLVGTDTKVIIEYWHGIHLPSNLAIPKSVYNALVRCDKPLSGFGFSANSVTFYFEDGAWIKSQLMAGQWPDVSRILDTPSNPIPVPTDLWNGLDAIEKFSEDGLCYFGDSQLKSHENENLGAIFEVKGLPSGPVMSIDQLNIIRSYVDKIDWFVKGQNVPSMIMFFGERIRGVIAGRQA